MKPLHPDAVFINSKGERTFYLLRATDKSSVFKADKDGVVESQLYSWAAFEQLVREDQVQYFQETANGVEISYTEEEIAFIRKKDKKLNLLSGEEYFRSEATFSDAGLQSSMILPISIVAVYQQALTRAKVLYGAFYMKNLSPQHREFLKANTVSLMHYSKDYALFSALRQQMDEILEGIGMHYTICTQTMRNLDNSIYKVGLLGFKPPAEAVILEIADELDARNVAFPSSSEGKNPTAGFKKMSLE